MPYPREQWVYALTALPDSAIKSIAAAYCDDYQINFKALPQSGLGMIKFRDTAFDESFFLGEFPLATTWLELTDSQGNTIEGAAQVMNDDADIATSLAIADAILANKALGYESLQEKVDQGMSIRKAQNQSRKAMLAKTTVDFSLLATTEDDDHAE